MRTTILHLLPALAFTACATSAPPATPPSADPRDCAATRCVDVVFALDASASAGVAPGRQMTRLDMPDWRAPEPASLLAAALDAIEATTAGLDSKSTAAGLVAFSGEAGVLFTCEIQRDAWTEATLGTDRSALLAGVARIRSRGACGRTNTPAGIEQALGLFSAAPSAKHVIVFQEGVPNAPGIPRWDDPPSEKAAVRKMSKALRAASEHARERSVALHWISFGLDDAAIEALLRETAATTGGSVVKLTALDALRADLETLLRNVTRFDPAPER